MSDVHTPPPFLESPEVDAFVQRNAHYYKTRWADTLAKGGPLDHLAKKQNQVSWNWAAFFFSYAWLFYRKLYLFGAVALAAAIGAVAAEQLTGERLSGILIGIAVAVGLYGNTWYLARTYRHVTEVQQTTQDPAARKAMLATAGGTNLSLALGAPVMAVAIAVGLPFLTGGINFPPPPPAAQTETPSEPAVNSELQEISAWWDAEGERVGILVTPQTMGLYLSGNVNVSDRGLISGTPDAFKPFRIVQEDAANEAWSFELIESPGSIWTVRKRWDEKRERFTLGLFPPGGEGLALGFVRRFTPDEVSKLSTAAVSAPVASSVPTNVEPVAANTTIPGRYNYLEDGHAGTITVSAAPENTFDVIIETHSESVGNQCRFGMARAKMIVGSRPPILSWNDGSNGCTVLLNFEGDFARIEGTVENCRKYCGDGAQFFGGYAR